MTDTDTATHPATAGHPRYTHDCEACRYLGTVAMPSFRYSETVDLYMCSEAGPDTAIIRFGDDGQDYTSLPVDFIRPGFNRYREFSLVKALAELQEPDPA